MSEVNTTETQVVWRDVRESLPAYDDRVLITLRGTNSSWSTVKIANRDRTDADGEHWQDDQNKDIPENSEVIAWAPLPGKFV